VFWKILKIIDYHKPRFVILENVKNLVSHDEKTTFETIKTNLEKKGYNIQFKVLNTSDITGIPQHRERIYIVCIRKDADADAGEGEGEGEGDGEGADIFKKFTLDFPAIPKVSISAMLETTPVASKYYYTEKSAIWDLVSESVTKKNTVYQYRRVYVRENKSNECPTLTANMGGGGHNVPLIVDNADGGIRKLTPRECFNFQGFPA
jgi:DNA (cytosine-5)-methyltransferase 1